LMLMGFGAGCSADTPATPLPKVEEQMADDDHGLFTPPTQDLFRATATTAKRLGHHGFIGTDHLLVTFLTDPRFRPTGVPELDSESVFKVAGELNPPYPHRDAGTGPTLRSPKLWEAINRAVDAARLAGAPPGLTPQQVWVGLLLHNSDSVRAILGRLGLDRRALLKAAGIDEPGDAPDSGRR